MEILKKYYFVVILVFAVVGVIALAIQISEIQTCEYFKYK